MPSLRASLSSLLLAALVGCSVAPEPEPVRFGGAADVQSAIAALGGQPCLVNFWATWCPPCVAEMPALRDVAREFEPRGVRVLGISLDLLGPGGERAQVLDKVRSFLAAREFELPTVVLEPAEYQALSAHYDLPGAVPVTLALDARGKVVDRHLGEASAEQLRALLAKALAP